MALWYGFARDLGPRLSLGGLVGFPYPPVNADGAAIAVETARNIWLYQYMIVAGAIFVGLVRWLLPHRWFRWSVGVSAVLIFFIWFRVQLDVMINNWFGTFYNMIQQALGKPGAVTSSTKPTNGTRRIESPATTNGRNADTSLKPINSLQI